MWEALIKIILAALAVRFSFWCGSGIAFSTNSISGGRILAIAIFSGIIIFALLLAIIIYIPINLQ